jgi:hypothetical protein
VPDWASGGSASRHEGLYEWLGKQLEDAYARLDPREAIDGHPIARPVPEALASFRAGLPATVPAWRLDGFSALAAGFVGVVPKDRAVRAVRYTIGPDDTVTPA